MANITIDSALKNGSITAAPTSGDEGTKIILTITPDEGYQLKKDSLKVTPTQTITTSDAGETSFTISGTSDISITAEFEKIPAPAAEIPNADADPSKIYSVTGVSFEQMAEVVKSVAAYHKITLMYDPDQLASKTASPLPAMFRAAIFGYLEDYKQD